MYSNLDSNNSHDENVKLEECKNCKSKVKKGVRLCPECGELNPTLRNHEIWKIIAVIFAIAAVITLVK
jgi:RNA polymerase subunit RPABC4/transcription elongation factor Spt4